MEVLRAKRAGACYGVQRALDMAKQTLDAGSPVYTLGPLIHNPQVVADLAQSGARTVDSVAEIEAEACSQNDGIDRGVEQSPMGETEASSTEAPEVPAPVPAVVIRSHGVTPDVLQAVADRGYQLVDATCPHVARAQKAAEELAQSGCRVVVLGEEGHPEVEGITAWARQAGGKVDVVSGPEDLPAGLYDPVGVVVQTTQRRENLESVVAALEAQGLHPMVRDTICAATGQRQRSAAELSGVVDAMVVIGGRNSSNTTRLAEICADSCERVFHIEAVEEIDPTWFAQCQTVGVTAGASTPEEQIAAVEDYLRRL